MNPLLSTRYILEFGPKYKKKGREGGMQGKKERRKQGRREERKKKKHPLYTQVISFNG